MNTIELKLIKRRKLAGPGEHYGVQAGNEVIDFHDNYKVTTMDDFSKNNQYAITEEAVAVVPIEEAKSRFADLKNYTYDFFTKNCEHWARRMVEGKFSSKQINGLIVLVVAISVVGIAIAASKKAA